MEYKLYFWGPLLCSYNVDMSIVSKIKEMGDTLTVEKHDHSNNLVGVIDRELVFEPNQQDHIGGMLSPYFNHYINFLINEWSQREDRLQSLNIDTINVDISNIWINYQKANDYNPSHNHDGDISFVLYVDIPQEMIDEPDIAPMVKAGAIQFFSGDNEIVESKNFNKTNLATQLLAKLTYKSFKPVTGQMFIFPSYLMHSVHQFKSDVERISVSGNLQLNFNNV